MQCKPPTEPKNSCSFSPTPGWGGFPCVNNKESAFFSGSSNAFL